MKRIALFLTISCSLSVCLAQQAVPRVLVFSKTAKYHHESIPAGIAAIKKLGIKDHFLVDTTTSTVYFCDDSLKHYAALVFLSPSGNFLDTAQKTDFKRYIEAGGGYMGIHGASTPEKEWTWYRQLVGAVFVNHPEPQIGIVIVADPNNNATRSLPANGHEKMNGTTSATSSPTCTFCCKPMNPAIKAAQTAKTTP